MERRLFPIVLLAAGLLAGAPAWAQLRLGQYEDEAPLGTWNILGPPSAQALGVGGAQLARAWDAAASLANPALLVRLPRFAASLAASYEAAALFRYAMVNTGVVESSGNLSAGVLRAEGGSVALRAGPWAIGFAAAAPESFARPKVDVGGAGDRLTFDQTGYLRVFHVGVARRLPDGWSLGLGLNYATGRLDRAMIETMSDPDRTIVISDSRSERFHGFFLNAGAAWDATARLTVGLAVRSPYLRKADAASLLRYEASPPGTDIRTAAAAVNAYRQPWVLGAGLAWRLAAAWSLAADAAFFGWTRYRVTYFGEPLERAFRNVIKAGGGVEYLAPAPLYGGSARIPFRLGVLIDAQPATSVRSTYLALTFGTGLELRTWAFGVSASMGRETGSGRSLKAGRIVLSARYIFRD